MRRIFEFLLLPIMVFFHGLLWMAARARKWNRRPATASLG